MFRILLRITTGCALLFTISILFMHDQPMHDQTIRALLIPSDCLSPCFMGIRPGITRMTEAHDLLEAHPWVGDIESRLDSGCCTIAVSWRWNGHQPDMLGDNENTVYFVYDPATGEQIVQNIALHTRITGGEAILALGEWSLADTGALKGLDRAYVEILYRRQFISLSADISCPLSRWRLWQAPITFALSKSDQDITGMQPLNHLC